MTEQEQSFGSSLATVSDVTEWKHRVRRFFEQDRSRLQSVIETLQDESWEDQPLESPAVETDFIEHQTPPVNSNADSSRLHQLADQLDAQLRSAHQRSAR